MSLPLAITHHSASHVRRLLFLGAPILRKFSEMQHRYAFLLARCESSRRTPVFPAHPLAGASHCVASTSSRRSRDRLTVVDRFAHRASLKMDLGRSCRGHAWADLPAGALDGLACLDFLLHASAWPLR